MFNKKLLLAGALAATVSAPAYAGFQIPAWERGSVVPDSVTEDEGVYTYEYTVINTSFGCEPTKENDNCFFSEGGVPIIIDWELPYFADSGIDLGSIQSPDGWDWAIETIGVANPTTGWEGDADWQDPDNEWYFPDSPFNDATQVLHWYVTNPFACDGFGAANAGVSIIGDIPVDCAGIVPSVDELGGDVLDRLGFTAHQNSLSGFSFQAPYASTPAPYQASWLFLPVQTGDPAFPQAAGGIPNSPSLRRADVPVPLPLALIGLGLVALVMRRR